CELEPDSERIAAQLRDHGLRAPLGSGHVPRQAGELFRFALEEPRDVASGGERLLTRASQHDRAHAFVASELLEQTRQLVACRHRDPVQLLGDVERDRRHVAVALESQAVQLRHAVTPSSRRTRRRIFPDGLFGSAVTKRYSRGRLKRASVSDARQCASSSCSVAVPTTTATTRWPRRSSGAPMTATSATPGWRASTSSTSSGWMFSPPDTIMSSTRPTTHRSPSSSMWPTSPVLYQPS